MFIKIIANKAPAIIKKYFKPVFGIKPKPAMPPIITVKVYTIRCFDNIKFFTLISIIFKSLSSIRKLYDYFKCQAINHKVKFKKPAINYLNCRP